MNYTDSNGNPATGVVWSPGPLPGTVWVLPEPGASSDRAVVVRVAKRQEVTADKVTAIRARWDFDLYATEADVAKRLAPKDWHAALGFVPAERVQTFEANDAPTLLDITA